MSRSISGKMHIPREKRGPRDRFAFNLPVGHYRLRDAFHGAKIDKRTTGPGMFTPDGLRKGARFCVKRAVWMEREGPTAPYILLECSAPWALGSAPLASAKQTPDGEIMWSTPVADDMRRLFELLDPDDSIETWLDAAMDTGRHQHGYSHAVLEKLLQAHVISKNQIEAALTAVMTSKNSRECF